MIYFGDESGIRPDFHRGTTWAPMGKTPVVGTTGAYIGHRLTSRWTLLPGRIAAYDLAHGRRGGSARSGQVTEMHRVLESLEEDDSRGKVVITV